MCLFQISTLHSTLGARSGTRGAGGGTGRSGLPQDGAVLPRGGQESCQGPPSTSASSHVFLGSAHFLLSGAGRASRQGTEQPGPCRGALGSHCSAGALGTKTNTPGPFLHVAQREHSGGLGSGDGQTPFPTLISNLGLLFTNIPLLHQPCFVSFPLPAWSHVSG